MTRWLRNRKRWAARRAIIEHERRLLACWDRLYEIQGQKSALEAAVAVRRQMFLDRWEPWLRDIESKPEAGALLLAQIGALR